MADGQSGTAEAARVGLLCGGGLLPVRVAEALAAGGARVVAVAIKGEADPLIEEHAHQVHWTGLAKLGRWIALFKSAGVEELLMCGSIRKQRMFGSKLALLPDWRTLRFWYGRLRSREDHTILGALADEFDKEGIRVGSVPEYCPELLIRPGCLTALQPTRLQWRDIEFAWPIAKQVAALQIGQCIVVKDRAVIAVEGIDGTDAALRRGGRLAGGGAVAVKVPKEGHDERFDIPCIGPDTVDMLHSSAVAVLAVEARRTIALDQEEVRRRAAPADVCIVALGADQVGSGDS
ncbi:MAG: LpxI family protein [Planctomycetota bacterium]|jgi:DUF1009 family protein